MSFKSLYPMDPATMTKECSKCGVRKKAEDFPKNKAFEFGRASCCKICENARQRKYWKDAKTNNPQAIERRLRNQRNWRAKTYGITAEQLILLENSCGGLCEICGKPPSMKGRATNALHIDHCHTTNKVRGMLCGRCNTAIGSMDDDVTLLQKMIDYLKRENPLDHS